MFIAASHGVIGTYHHMIWFICTNMAVINNKNLSIESDIVAKSILVENILLFLSRYNIILLS